MEHYFKILKKLTAVLLILSFFSFGKFAYAQGSDTTSISECVVKGAVTGFAVDTVAEYLPGTSLTQQKVSGKTDITATTETTAQAEAAKTESTAVSVPITDAVSNIYLGTIDGVTAASASFQDVGKMNLDGFAYKVAQCTLNQLTNSIVSWIKGGFNGSPKFAVDTKKLFQDIAQGVASDFARQIKNLQACKFTPTFIDDLTNSIDRSAQRKRLPPKIKCPFPEQQVKASQFYNDFSTFGWKGMRTALEDGGNPFSVNVLTGQELANRQAEAKATEDQKKSWSNGFADIIDTENCDYPSDVQDDLDNPDVEISAETRAYWEKTYCPTATPGKIVGDQLTKSIGAEQDRLGMADNMNKIISALIGELTKESVKGIFKSANSATRSVDAATGYNGSGSTGATGGTVPAGSAVPYVSTSASDIARNGVTLNAHISPTNLSGTMWFEWSTSQDLLLQSQGTRTSSQSYQSSSTQITYSYQQSGLTRGTTYYFRAVGRTSQKAVWYSAPQSFSTLTR